MKLYWGSLSVAARILNLGTRWRWVVSFTPRLLYPGTGTNKNMLKCSLNESSCLMIVGDKVEAQEALETW